MSKSSRFWPRFILVLSGIMIGAVLFGGLALFLAFRPEHYMTFDSPDGRHRLLVFRTPTIFAAPGQAGDAPGRIDLIDSEGRELNSMPLAMVQLASQPQWLEDRVTIKLVLDWALQREDNQDDRNGNGHDKDFER